MIDNYLSWIYSPSVEVGYMELYLSDIFTFAGLENTITLDLTETEMIDHFEFTFDTDNSGTFVSNDFNNTYTYAGTFSAQIESSSAEILFFEIDGSNGELSGTDILIDYYGQSPLEALTPVIAIPLGATISPNTGVAQDFNYDVTYTVTAQDGTTKVYTVILTQGELIQ